MDRPRQPLPPETPCAHHAGAPDPQPTRGGRCDCAVDGAHTLVVRELVNWGGPEFAYAIRFAPRTPGITLTSGIARVALPPATRQPLNIC